MATSRMLAAVPPSGDDAGAASGRARRAREQRLRHWARRCDEERSIGVAIGRHHSAPPPKDADTGIFGAQAVSVIKDIAAEVADLRLVLADVHNYITYTLEHNVEAIVARQLREQAIWQHSDADMATEASESANVSVPERCEVMQISTPFSSPDRSISAALASTHANGQLFPDIVPFPFPSVESSPDPAGGFAVEDVTDSVNCVTAKDGTDPVDDFAVESFANPVGGFAVEDVVDLAVGVEDDTGGDHVKGFAVEQRASLVDGFAVESFKKSSGGFAVEDAMDLAVGVEDDTGRGHVKGLAVPVPASLVDGFAVETFNNPVGGCAVEDAVDLAVGVKDDAGADHAKGFAIEKRASLVDGFAVEDAMDLAVGVLRVEERASLVDGLAVESGAYPVQGFAVEKRADSVEGFAINGGAAALPVRACPQLSEDVLQACARAEAFLSNWQAEEQKAPGSTGRRRRG